MTMPTRRAPLSALAIAAVVVLTGTAHAQSLLRAPAPAATPVPADSAPPMPNPPAAPAPVRGGDDRTPNGTPPETLASLREYSITAVVPPPPKTFQKHDTVEIIINESSVQKYEQSLDRQKKYNLSGEVAQLPSLRHLLEAQLRPGATSPLAEVGVRGDNKFQGDGTMERKDRFTTRITAQVLEVKPNGNLVLEARKVMESNGETTTLLVSGICSPSDITANKTVQSAQLADLVIKVENTGEIRDAARRGLIPRVFDTIFNF